MYCTPSHLLRPKYSYVSTRCLCTTSLNDEFALEEDDLSIYDSTDEYDSDDEDEYDSYDEHYWDWDVNFESDSDSSDYYGDY